VIGLKRQRTSLFPLASELTAQKREVAQQHCSVFKPGSFV